MRPANNTVYRNALLSAFALAMLIPVMGCPNTVKTVKNTVKMIKDSPRPGSSADSVHLVDSGNQLGFSHDLAVIDGKPVLAYSAPDGLRFAQATVPHPKSAADWQIHLVDSTDRAGTRVKMLISDGRPFLFYSSGKSPDNHYQYAYAVSSEPESADDWQIVEFAEDCSFRPRYSAAMIDGRPAFLTRDSETSEMVYAIADSSTPAAVENWTAVPITNGEYLIGATRLTELDGRPVITLMTKDHHRIIALIGNSAQPGGIEDWQTEVVIDSKGIYLSSMDMASACIDGQPAIIHNYDEPPELRYSYREVAADGKASWQSTNVLSWGDCSSGIDLIDVEGRPLIAYSFWAQSFAIHADSAAPAGPKDWLMDFATKDVAEGDYRECRAAYIDGKVVMSIFGFDTGQGEGLFFSVLE